MNQKLLTPRDIKSQLTGANYHTSTPLLQDHHMVQPFHILHPRHIWEGHNFGSTLPLAKFSYLLYHYHRLVEKRNQGVLRL